MIELLNIDCTEYMAGCKDNQFDLAIVDPPYGLGDRLTEGGHKKNPMERFRKSYEQKRWDVAPNEIYFKELYRISANQIIWGGNYFNLNPSRGIICWDKKQMMPTFSRWEFAWTSFDKPAKMFEMMFGDDPLRTHPTQKPIQLYKWLLKNYAKEGDKIIDTHLGSGSSAIAAYDFGCDFVGCEIDKEYYDAAVKRFETYKLQLKLF